MPRASTSAGQTNAANDVAAASVVSLAREPLEKTLGKLVKKQAEPAFPEVEAWTVGDKQATGSDAVAAAVAAALRLPAQCVLVVPSEVFASALTFDLGVLGKDRRVVSAAAFAEAEDKDEKAVLLAFDPAGSDHRAALAAAAAKAKASAASAAMLTVALAGGGACDAAEGPEGAGAARAEALERAAARAGA